MEVFWTDAIALEVGHRLQAVADYLSTELTRMDLLAPVSEPLMHLLHEHGKILASPIAQGAAISPEDHSLWGLHPVLMHAVTAHLSQPQGTREDWQTIVPIAAAAELLGVTFDLLDDLQDDDNPYIQDLGVAKGTSLLVILQTLVQNCLASLPSAALEHELQQILRKTMQRSSEGQYRDILHETMTVTLDQVMEVNDYKAGSLFAGLYAMGGLVGAYATHSPIEASAISRECGEFGRQVGINFQLQNDLGDAFSAHKSDRQKNKKTIPLVVEAQFIAEGYSLEDAAQQAKWATVVAIRIANAKANSSLQRLQDNFQMDTSWVRWIVAE